MPQQDENQPDKSTQTLSPEEMLNTFRIAYQKKRLKTYLFMFSLAFLSLASQTSLAVIENVTHKKSQQKLHQDNQTSLTPFAKIMRGVTFFTSPVFIYLSFLWTKKLALYAKNDKTKLFPLNIYVNLTQKPSVSQKVLDSLTFQNDQVTTPYDKLTKEDMKNFVTFIDFSSVQPDILPLFLQKIIDDSNESPSLCHTYRKTPVYAKVYLGIQNKADTFKQDTENTTKGSFKRNFYSTTIRLKDLYSFTHEYIHAVQALNIYKYPHFAQTISFFNETHTWATDIFYMTKPTRMLNHFFKEIDQTNPDLSQQEKLGMAEEKSIGLIMKCFSQDTQEGVEKVLTQYLPVELVDAYKESFYLLSLTLLHNYASIINFNDIHKEIEMAKNNQDNEDLKRTILICDNFYTKDTGIQQNILDLSVHPKNTSKIMQQFIHNQSHQNA